MPHSIARNSVSNIVWAYASFGSTKVLNLVAVVVVARYLDPADFGMMAISMAIMGYFEIVSQFGLGAALISARDKIEETASAVCLCAMAISCTMALVLWCASGTISAIYHTPALQDLLGTIAIGLVLHAATTVHMSFLFRELRLRDKLLPDIVRGVSKGVVSIVLAFHGFGVWALAYGYLASAILGSITLVLVRPWRPTRIPDRATIRHVLMYGVHLIGAETINSTPRLLDNLLVGKVLGTTALGIYSLAFRIPELGIKTFTNVAGSVLHPVMASIQSDPTELRAYYYGALRYCSLLMFGLGAAIAVLAAPLTHVLYAPKWYDMIVPMQFIAVAFSLSTLNMIPGKLLKAVNRTDLLFRVSLVNLPMFVVCIWAAVPYGIVAVSVAQLALAVLRLIPTFLVTKWVLDVTLVGTIRTLMPATLSSAAAAVATLYALEFDLGAELPRLVVASAVFCLAYGATMLVVAPEIVGAGSRMVARRRRVA